MDIIKLQPSDEFYGDTSSCYLRIAFIEPLGFQISIRNEALLHSDGDTKAGDFLGAIARGMLEVAYGQGENIYGIGMRSLFRDTIEASAEELSEDHRKVWMSDDINRSIH